MVQPVKINKFIDDFQSYLASRGIDQDSINSIKATYVKIDPESELVKKIQAMSVAANVDYRTLSERLATTPGNLDYILFPAILYLYLDAILDGDIDRAEQYWSIAECGLEHLEENARIKYYQIRFALAYDPETKQFKTDNLIINQTNLMQEYPHLLPKALYYFCADVWPGFNNEESLYDYSDYTAENTINYIMSMMNKLNVLQHNKAFNQTFKYDPRYLQVLPLPLIFSHPQQNDATIQVGLYLLSIGVEPSYILGASRQNDTEDYRLLNHCVELLAADLKKELFEDGEDNEKLNLKIFYAEHPYIPAAKFFSQARDELLLAARLNYKPAIAHCLSISEICDYGASTQTQFDHLLMLWQEKYLSTADTLRFLTRKLEGIDEFAKSPSLLENPEMLKSQPPIITTKINGLTVTAPSDTICFEQRVHILAVLCSAHRILIDDRFNETTINLDNFFAIFSPLLSVMTSRQNRLQKWRDTEFGNLVIMQYIQLCMSFTSYGQIRQYYYLIIISLLSCHPQQLSAWQKELLYKRLAEGLHFNKDLTAAYQALKITRHGNTIEIGAKEIERTPFTLNDTLWVILCQISVPDLLTLSLRAVSKRFKKIIDMILHDFLKLALGYQDKVIAFRYLERILYLSYVSENLNFRRAGIDYYYKLLKLCNSPPPVLSNETNIRLATYIEKAKNAAVASGQLDVLRAIFPSNPDSANYLLLSESAHSNVVVLAYLVRATESLPNPHLEKILFELYHLYLNELLSGQMTKERHSDCLFIIKRQLSKNEPTEVETMFHTAIMCQDWALLLLLCRFHPEHYCYVLKLENLSKQIADANLFIHTKKCIVTANAPLWWHKVQQECFSQLVLEKTQLLNLFSALLNQFLKLPTHSGPELLGVLGSHAPQTSNMAAKNSFVKSLTELLNDLKNQSVDVIHAIQKLVKLVNDFRTHLISNKNRGYLQIVDRFFEIPKEYSLDILKQCIDKCLQRYGIDESPTVSNAVVGMIGRAA